MKPLYAAFSLFFLLSFWALPVDAASPFSSEKTYRITETELSRLELDLDRALLENGKQKEQSETLKKQLRTLETQSEERKKALETVRKSFEEYAKEEQKKQKRLRRERNAAIGVVGLMVVALVCK
jgi:flagellar motility protein MotE (MotC chaperone)